MKYSKDIIIKISTLLLWILFLFVFGANQVIAGECGSKGASCSHPAPAQAKPTKVENVNVEGEIICIACTLKHEEEAKAQCSIYGHDHSVKVDKIVDANGKEISQDYSGQIYQVLPNDRSNDLLTQDNHHKKVTISGKIYPNANLIEVERYSIKNGENTEDYKWCEKCNKMVPDEHRHER